MGLKRGVPRPALVVPDVETCLVFGGDDGAWVATEEPGRARLLVLPERVPDELVAPVRSAWSLMADDPAMRTYALDVHGVSAQDVLHGEDDAASDDEEGAGDSHADDHAGHDDHGDMMAITGEPSADGLVMEAMDVHAGPLGISLPGGLLVQAGLDGDVVADCQVRQTLTARDHAPPDPWSAVAWTTAELAATERASGATPHRERWFRLAAVEVERTVSHLAWLHRFCRLLGWAQLTDRVRAVLTAAVSARGALPVVRTTPDLPDVPVDGGEQGVLRAADAGRELADALCTSKAFARRTAGLGRLAADDVRSRGLAGPTARASGVGDDARTDDPGYARLRFEPVVRDEGDARARALVRVAEAVQSLDLAAGAIGRTSDSDAEEATPEFGRAPAGAVESARGPVRVLISADGTPQRTAPGARAARDAAGDLAIGREWAAALVTIASFDVSPWRVGP